MTALEFIKYLKEQFSCVPMYMNGNKPIEASNAQLRRWLDMGAVQINGERPKANDEVEFHIWEFVWFLGSKKKISVHYSEEDRLYSKQQNKAEEIYQNIIKERRNAETCDKEN